jgi:aerobic carbon-monoxide dehydrogenase medium subunit
MISAFAYARPATLDEALGLLADHGPETKVLAGGQSLIPLLKLRLAHPDRLIDIGRLSELRGVCRLDDGGLAVGALTTYAELMASDARHYGVLADALPEIGDVQVRNRGTVGGSLAHADPSSDLPACLLALGAEVVLRSRRGARTVPVDGFFAGPFQSGIEPDELLTEIRLPAPRDDAGSAYASLTQPASGYSMVGVAAVVFKGGGAGIGITGVGEHPYRARAVEAALVAGASSAEAAAHAADGITVAGDIHADPEYRRAMATVYTRRAIEAARARLG